MTRQRLVLLGLVLAFAAPFVIGWGLFAGGWRPDDPATHGTLVTPPRGLDLAAWRLAGSDSSPDNGQWVLALMVRGECAAPCRDALYLMRQIESTQAREASRIQRVVLADDPAPASLAEAVAAIGRTQLWLGALTGLARGLPGEPAGDGQLLAIIDPLGNLMMVYPGSFDPDGVRRDIERLLKFSWVG